MNSNKKFLYFYENGKMVKGPNQKMKGSNPKLYGNCTGLKGDYTTLEGNCTGVWGDCTKVTGNLDTCSITTKEREECISLLLLTIKAQSGKVVINKKRDTGVTN